MDENDNNTKNSLASVSATSPILHQVVEEDNHNPLAAVATSTSSNYQSSVYVDQSDDEYGDPYDIQNEINEALTNNTEMLKQIQVTVLRMNADVAGVQDRLKSLEKEVHALMALKKSNSSRATRSSKPKWWPFEGITPGWFVLLVLWPFFVNRLNRMLTPAHRK